MRKVLLLLSSIFVVSCSGMMIDYSDYPIDVRPGNVRVHDLSKNAEATSEIYLESQIVEQTLGDARHLIVLTEVDGVPLKDPATKRRFIEGAQAIRIPAGVHSVKFQWIATSWGGMSFNLPYSLINFNFIEGRRYFIRGSGNYYWIEDMDTREKLEADIQRGV